MSDEPIVLDGSEEPYRGDRVLAGTDLEINYNLNGDGSLTLRVNKAGVLVFRCKLDNAVPALSGAELMSFSTFAPDFVFKIGDSAEGLARLMRSVGVEVQGGHTVRQRVTTKRGSEWTRYSSF